MQLIKVLEKKVERSYRERLTEIVTRSGIKWGEKIVREFLWDR